MVYSIYYLLFQKGLVLVSQISTINTFFISRSMMQTFHMIFGFAVLLTGTVALTTTKGGVVHRKSGSMFFFSMLAVSLSAMYLDIIANEIPVIGLLVAYLITTSWVTIKRPEGILGVIDKLAFVCILLTSIGLVNHGWQVMRLSANHANSVPAGFFFVFGSIAAVAAALDFLMLVRGGIYGRHRIARHVWRMCIAFLMAVMSVLSQKSVIPEKLQGSPVLWAPVLALILVMFVWLVRVLFTGWWNKQLQMFAQNSKALND